MNKYKIVTFSYGMANEIFVDAYDVSEAISVSCANLQEIIKVELVGSAG